MQNLSKLRARKTKNKGFTVNRSSSQALVYVKCFR